jgi:hypothetical protein
MSWDMGCDPLFGEPIPTFQINLLLALMTEVKYSSVCQYGSTRIHCIASKVTAILKLTAFEISDLNLCFTFVLLLPPTFIIWNLCCFPTSCTFPIDKSIGNDIVEK